MLEHLTAYNQPYPFTDLPHSVFHLFVFCSILKSFRSENGGYINPVASTSPPAFQHSAPVCTLFFVTQNTLTISCSTLMCLFWCLCDIKYCITLGIINSWDESVYNNSAIVTFTDQMRGQSMGLWLLILIVKGARLFNSLDYCIQGTNLFSLMRQKGSVAEKSWWATKWAAKLLLFLLLWEHLRYY